MKQNIYQGRTLFWLSHAILVTIFALLLMFPVSWECFEQDLLFPFIFKAFSVVGSMTFICFAKTTHYLVNIELGKESITIRTLYKAIEMPYASISNVKCISPGRSLLRELFIKTDADSKKGTYSYLGLCWKDMVSLCGALTEKGVKCISIMEEK